jgi:hypothetical protein
VLKKDDVWFNVAWNKHQKSNTHHWQYCGMYKKDGCVALEMTFEYVIEML